MDWSHGTAFILGIVAWWFLAMFYRNKANVVTRRDIMACHIYPALVAQNPQAASGAIATDAVHQADSLLHALDNIKPEPKENR